MIFHQCFLEKIIFQLCLIAVTWMEFQISSPRVQKMELLGSGMLTIILFTQDVSQQQQLIQLVLSLLKKSLFQVGQMGKSDHFELTLKNHFGQSITLIKEVSQLLIYLKTLSSLLREELMVKSESGKSEQENSSLT